WAVVLSSPAFHGERTGGSGCARTRPRSHGRGLPDGGVDDSVPIRSRPVVRRDLHVDVQAAILDFALSQLAVLQHEKLRRGFELVNEAADAAIVPGKRRAIGELHELTVAFRLGFRRRPLDSQAALLRQLLDPEK